MTLNLHNIFDRLPITDYIVIPKRRGRKKNKNINQNDYNKDIISGSIITLKLRDKIKGVDLKKKKKKKNVKYFRNSVTVVMIIDGKKINFKISKNGKFQLTGCKTTNQAKECLKFIWKYIKDYKDIYEFTRGNTLEILFVPAMRNIDFSLGILIDRESLSNYINLMTPYYSMLETSFGYTGVNIKFPMNENIENIPIIKIIYDEKNSDWNEQSDIYKTFLDLLPKKERAKKINQKRYNSFLVFHSGKVIMSGCNRIYMEQPYYDFLNIIKECYDVIKERLI